MPGFGKQRDSRLLYVMVYLFQSRTSKLEGRTNLQVLELSFT